MQIGFGAGILQRAGVPYDVDASNYFSMINARGGSISTGRKVLVNKFIKDLKSDLAISRLSDAFDVLYLLAHENQVAALTNLVKDAHHGIAFNSPTFTTDRGFTGNGSSAYINTNYNPSTQGVAYTLNSASFGIYSRNALTGAPIGSGTRSYLFQSGPTTSARINGGEVAATSGTSGFYACDRSSSSRIDIYKGGVSIANDVDVSAGFDNANMTILTLNTSYSTSQLAMGYVGKSFTASNSIKLNNCIEWFLDAIGAGVQ